METEYCKDLLPGTTLCSRGCQLFKMFDSMETEYVLLWVQKLVAMLANAIALERENDVFMEMSVLETECCSRGNNVSKPGCHQGSSCKS